MRTRGLTLLEVIMLIVIIGVVVVLVLPTLGRARINSRQTQCASNIRQILTAMYL